MPRNVWPQEWIVALHEYLARGWSFTQTAIGLSDRFAGRFTRSSIAGKARRCGIHSLLTFSDGRRMSKPRARLPSHGPVPRPQPRSAFPPCVELEPLHKPLADLARPESEWLGFGECKWPFGDNNYTFCARPCIKISMQGADLPQFTPYCAWHMKVATGQLSAAEKAARVTSEVT